MWDEILTSAKHEWAKNSDPVSPQKLSLQLKTELVQWRSCTAYDAQ